MAKKRIEIEAGTGSVFADFGYPDAKERRLKVELAMEVNRILAERRIAQDRAAKLLRVRQPQVSDLVRYRLNRFSIERLMDFLTRLGKDVEIRIAARPSGRRRSNVHVRLQTSPGERERPELEVLMSPARGIVDSGVADLGSNLNHLKRFGRGRCRHR